MRILLILCVGITLLNACSHSARQPTVHTGIYFWKSDWYGFDNEEAEYLEMLNPDKLYFKFFEIAPDDNFVGVPIAKTGFNAQRSDYHEIFEQVRETEIIPVVFIQNEVLRSASHQQLNELADNTVFLINKMFKERMPSGMTFKELQLDCDWTATTRDAYFYLIEKVKELSEKKISCTLRLYPYKYRQKMGIPPVDRVTLMCYNLLSPVGNDERNSILEPVELEKYLVGVHKYPLPLDVVLPLFSYVHWYQYGQFKGMLKASASKILGYTQHIEGLWHLVLEDFEYDYKYIRAGDRIKIETVKYPDVQRSIQLLKEHLEFDDKLTISLFHLDATTLSNYTNEEILNIYNAFSSDAQ